MSDTKSLYFSKYYIPLSSGFHKVLMPTNFNIYGTVVSQDEGYHILIKWT
jgi:hypothetical protein